MPQYAEIESPAEIRRLNDALWQTLRDGLVYVEDRIIGYSHAKVRFLSGTGTDVFYWSNRISKDKKTAISLFGHGEPGSSAPLNIDVQFNLSIANFSRRSGGAFLRHVPTNNVVLAHRGITTIGHGHVPKADLFSEMAVTVREATTGNDSGEFLFIGKLDSPTLVHEIDDFSKELRRSVKAIKTSATKTGGNSKKRSNTATALSGRLRQAFDEPSGKRQIKARRPAVADCYHGTVVRAIRDAYDAPAETFKSREIDLTAIIGNRVYLFEVKTSADSQSVYTAVGQLFAHAPVVVEHAPAKTLIKVMVLPEKPSQRLCRVLKNHLGIQLLTFTRSVKGRIAIDGLSQLR